jgi:hypothetical protein
MEDILILILQAVGQILFEFFAYWPWDWFWYTTPYDNRDTKSDGTLAAVFFSIGLGALIGWLSLFVFPDVLVKWGWLRITLLFISPLGSGFMAREMARWRQKDKSFIEPMTHFWIGLCFSIGLVWVRFAFAHRPS